MDKGRDDLAREALVEKRRFSEAAAAGHGLTPQQYQALLATGLRGSPFFAVNGWLRQEVNYGGSLTAGKKGLLEYLNPDNHISPLVELPHELNPYAV